MLSNAQVALLAAAHLRQPVENQYPYSGGTVKTLADEFLAWLENNSEAEDE